MRNKRTVEWGRAWPLLLPMAVCLACNSGNRETLPEEEAEPVLETDPTQSTASSDDRDSETIEVDSDTGDFREGDAGITWDDGTISVEQPCGNDCRYVYRIQNARWSSSGASRFNIASAPNGDVRAYGLDSVSFIHYVNFSSYWGHAYRQRIVSDYTLDEKTMGLMEGTAEVQTEYLETAISKYFSFTYNSSAKEFSYSLQVNDRKWERTLSSAVAPLIVFNHKQYPQETWGIHSSLTAFLIGKHYDFSLGGVQKIAIFSPDMERLDTLEVEMDPEAVDTLIVHLPSDSWRPLRTTFNSSLGDMTAESLSIVYQHDIPTSYSTLYGRSWRVVSAPSFETNLAQRVEASPVFPSDLPTDFTSSPVEIVSGAVNLAGTVDAPESEGPHPTVVFLPGWEHLTRKGEVGAVDFYQQLAAHLASNGYLVLRTDARGNGASGGDLSVSTVSELVEDVHAMISHLSANEAVDGSRLFLLAKKEGAHIAASAARQWSPAVAGIILLAPMGRSFREWAAFDYIYYLENGGFSQGLDSGEADGTGEDIENVKTDFFAFLDQLLDDKYEGKTWRGHTALGWRSISDLDLVKDPTGLPPTLVLVAAEDHLVSPEQGHDIYTAMKDAGVDASYEELGGLTHAFTPGNAEGMWPEHGSMEAVAESAVDAVMGWLDSQTGGGR